MKKILVLKMMRYKMSLAILLLFSISDVDAQAGMWTWVNGDTTINLPPHFGTQGIPDSLNHPAGSYEGCEWTDKQGNFWFFESGIPFSGFDNDLWKYDPNINKWAWMKGPGVANDSGNYGIQGVPSSSNLPPSRIFGMASWADTSGNLWMYGGYNNVNYGGQDNSFNDLWKFDIATNNWTWVNGSSVPNQEPVYGVQGIPSPLNTPGARTEVVCTWADSLNNLWLFGGASVAGAAYNDLWKYSIENNEWTWMKGTDTLDSHGVFGTKGVEDPSNVPTGRWCYSRWKDKNGNFWLFGGKRYWSGGYYLNDLWKYNISTNNWTWIKGPNNIPMDTGVTGPKCEMDTSFNPISRLENRSCWADNEGNFWMFGGLAVKLPFPYAIWLNDMWVYNIGASEWTLVWQDSLFNQQGHYEPIGVTSPCNRPLGRMGSVSWFNSNTNSMYLFGGYQYYIPGSGNFRSILWKYTLDTTCKVYDCLPTSVMEYDSLNELNISPNPASSSINIDYNIHQTATLTFTNTYGSMVKQLTLYPYFKNRIVYVDDLAAGVYLVTLHEGDRIVSGKMVVSR